MANPIIPPFSARNRGAHAHIDSDFPETARVGLIHLLHDLIRRRYIRNWGDVAREAERISREPVRNYDGAEGTARSNSETFLKKLPWEKVLDFCERLYNSLPNEMPRSAEAKRYIAVELERLFAEEALAFDLRDGRVKLRGRLHTSTQASRAQVVLGDPRLASARAHFNKAQKYFRSASQPDPENAVKEAVCAVEATARALFPDSAEQNAW
jgi:hypothetical protein